MLGCRWIVEAKASRLCNKSNTVVLQCVILPLTSVSSADEAGPLLPQLPLFSFQDVFGAKVGAFFKLLVKECPVLLKIKGLEK